MRILFLLRLWPVYGGGETVALRLANAFAIRGEKVYIAYFRHTTYNTLPYIHDEIECHLYDFIRCNEYEENESDAPMVNDLLCSLINSKKIDVVLNIWHPLSYIKEIKKRTSAKVIWCRHATFAQPMPIPIGLRQKVKRLVWSFCCPPNIKFAGKWVDDILPYVDKFVFLSPEYVKQYKCYCHNKANLHKIGSIANPLCYDESISEEEFNSKEKMVVVVSRLEENVKNVSYVFKTWKIIEQCQNKDIEGWKLYIVGDGKSKKEYEKLALDLKLSRVKFVGFQYPEPYYKQSKIFMMTSHSEGFPMTILEAEQFGVVPVVMDSTVALRSMIKNGVNGFVLPYGDVQGMARTMKKLMLDENKISKFAKRSLKYVGNFSVDVILESWYSLFKELMNV